MEGLTIRARIEADDEEVVVLLNRIDHRLPPVSVQEVRNRRALEPKDLFVQRWVGELNGSVVAFGGLFEMRSEEPGAYHVNLGVDPDRWGEGFGSRMAAVLLARADEVRAPRLYAYLFEDEPAPLEFARHRGFEPTGRGERMSRLDVHAANLDGFVGVEERLRSEDIHITTLAALGVDNTDILHQLHELDGRTQQDIPGTERWQKDPYEEWLAWILTASGVSPESQWIAMHGERPVGVARLQRQGQNAAWNAYTGVDREYRGKGIARALKLCTIEWSRQNGVDFIYTGNEAANERMLSINIALGYHMLPKRLEMLRRLAVG